MRDLKHYKTGWCGMCCALTSLVLFTVCVVDSVMSSGEAQTMVGTVSLLGLVLAVGGFLLGIFGIREQKVRPIPPRTGLALGLIMTVVLGGLYIGGMW